MKSCMTTLCYIEKDDCYLMLHRVKKEQDINKDKWIGIGGHFEGKESPEECLLREVKEETGLTLINYRFRGLITFVTDCYETEYMCLYTSDEFEGELTECTEGNLEWVPKNKLRQLNLWEGDYPMGTSSSRKDSPHTMPVPSQWCQKMCTILKI